MKNQNLFIVENDPLESNRLISFLEKRFSNTLTISTFTDGETALKNINSNTTIVILDYDLKGERGDVLLKEIKKINALTEVIILSSAEDIATAIDAFRKGASNYVIKGESTTRILYSMVLKIMNYPVKILVERFAVNKILAIFLTYFIFIGILVYLGMQLLP